MKRMNLLGLIKVAQGVLAKHGDMPVVVGDWMSDGKLCNRVDKVSVMEVGDHPLRAYKGRSYSVKGRGVKVFSVESSEV